MNIHRKEAKELSLQCLECGRAVEENEEGVLVHIWNQSIYCAEGMKNWKVTVKEETNFVNGIDANSYPELAFESRFW